MPILAVAPHWGAWIEIDTNTRYSAYQTASHPTGVRGLKYARGPRPDFQRRVAPHWGAWIEISTCIFTRGRNGCRTPLGCVD